MKHDSESATNYETTQKGMSCKCSVWTIEYNEQLYHQ